MRMFGKFRGQRRASDEGAVDQNGKDEAIIHQSVPEEVLLPRGRSATPADMSWLDEMPRVEPKGPDSPETEQVQAEKSAKEVPPPEPGPATVGPAEAEKLTLSNEKPNAEASARARFPCGWLVVVEGPGVGEWFVLERGVSHIGSAEGQTVRLDFGDASVVSSRHAALAYDEGRNAFILNGGSDAPVRLNGVPARPQAMLRDGDVIAVGGTSLRLVALCSPNFHWNAELRDV